MVTAIGELSASGAPGALALPISAARFAFAFLAQRGLASDALEPSVPDTDWQSLGLVLAGLGAFLIGLSVLARGERGLVEAHLPLPVVPGGPGSDRARDGRSRRDSGESSWPRADDDERAPWTNARRARSSPALLSSGAASARSEPAKDKDEPRASSPPRPSRFGALREALFLRAQLVVGFTWLALGFALQLLGRFHSASEPVFPVGWTGVVVVATLILLAIAWGWSLRATRELVRDALKERGVELDEEPALARDLGDLFGVEPSPEDTVETFSARLEAAIGIVRKPRAQRGAHPSLFDLDEE